MCVHMQNPFEPGQAHFITSARRDIFGLGLASMCCSFFSDPSVS